jgi:hypothetical protein
VTTTRQGNKKTSDDSVPAPTRRRVSRTGTLRCDGSTVAERVPRTPRSASYDSWHLTTGYPPNCSRCRHHVNPEFIEILVNERVLVFCGRPCRLEWETEHPLHLEMGSVDKAKAAV